MKLVAETERAAWLRVGRARPQPAAHVLVKEPTVHQQIERVVGSANLNRAQRLIPALAHGIQAGLGSDDVSVAGHQLMRLVYVLGLAQQEHEAASLSRRQGEGDVERGAGIEPCAEAARERPAPERRWSRQRTVATEKRQAVSRRRAKRLAGMRKGDAVRELSVVRVCCQDCASGGVELRDDVHLLSVARRP